MFSSSTLVIALEPNIAARMKSIKFLYKRAVVDISYSVDGLYKKLVNRKGFSGTEFTALSFRRTNEASFKKIT